MTPQDSIDESGTYRPVDDSAHAQPSPDLETAETLGAALRAARRASGRPLDELAITTRIPARYLMALEENRLADLPARPFALGHARAYAQALGLDETLAAERLRREYDLPSQKLEPPVGVAFDDPPRRTPLWIGGVAVLAVAVVSWNVFQRINLIDVVTPTDLAAIPESWRIGDTPGVMALDAPHPAPPDQTTPVLYVTPGLEAELTPDTVGPEQAVVDPGGPVGAAFNPRGAIYGAAAGRSGVILQARRASSIVVRAADGVVHFARQLAAGEAWRAPGTPGLTVDVSDPAAFDIFLNGERAGRLEQALTPLAGLTRRAESLARQAAAEAEERNRAAVEAAEERVRQAQERPDLPTAPLNLDPPEIPAEAPVSVEG